MIETFLFGLFKTCSLEDFDLRKNLLKKARILSIPGRQAPDQQRRQDGGADRHGGGGRRDRGPLPSRVRGQEVHRLRRRRRWQGGRQEVGLWRARSRTSATGSVGEGWILIGSIFWK